MVVDNASDILVLRQYYKLKQTFTMSEDIELANALIANLKKNSRQLRLQSLLLLKRFETLKFI